jgi:hypothetical protein
MVESWSPCHVQQYNLRPRVAVTIKVSSAALFAASVSTEKLGYRQASVKTRCRNMRFCIGVFGNGDSHADPEAPLRGESELDEPPRQVLAPGPTEGERAAECVIPQYAS